MQPPQLLHNEPHISPTLFPPCPPSLQSSSLSSLPLSSFNWRLQEIFSVSTVLLYLSGCTLGRSCYRPPKHWTAVRGCPCPAIFPPPPAISIVSRSSPLKFTDSPSNVLLHLRSSPLDTYRDQNILLLPFSCSRASRTPSWPGSSGDFSLT